MKTTISTDLLVASCGCDEWGYALPVNEQALRQHHGKHCVDCDEDLDYRYVTVTEETEATPIPMSDIFGDQQ